MSEPEAAETGRTGSLSSRTIRFFGIGQAAEGITNHSLTAFLLFYYTSILGLSGTLAGAALMIGLIFDAVTDPLVAVISDRTHSRWGRRHPYMFASALPLGGFLALAFLPPVGLADRLHWDEQWLLFAWLALLVVATRAALTLFHVPHMALGAELSDDFDERTRVVAARALSGVIGVAAAVVSYFVLVALFATPEYPDPRLNPRPYAVYAMGAGAFIVAAILLSTFGTRDRIPLLLPPDQSFGDRRVLRVLAGDMLEALRIRSFRALFFGFALCFLAFGFTNALGTHSALYFWHISLAVQGVYGIAVLVGTVAGMIWWRSYAARHDKKPTFLTGLAWFTLFAAVPPLAKVVGLFPTESSPAYVPTLLAVGFGWSFSIASSMVVVGSMMADITDEDELCNRRRREGIFFGSLSFASKAASGMGTVLAGVVYDFAGLARGLDPSQAPPGSAQTLGLSTGLVIVVLVVLAVSIFRGYELTRARHSEIRRSLDARSS